MENNIVLDEAAYTPEDLQAIRAALAEDRAPPRAAPAENPNPQEQREQVNNRRIERARREDAKTKKAKEKEPKDIDAKITINEDSPDIDTPDTFKFPLYDYQKRSVKRALDLLQSAVAVNQCTITSTAVKLADPFGSGKTLISLAIIAHMPMPPAYLVPCSPAVVGGRVRIEEPLDILTHDGRYPRVLKRPSGVLRFAIYVVGAPVFIQCFHAIKKFTNFTVFAIYDVYSLMKFERMYDEGIAENYDIVLVKNGEVTENFHLRGEVLESRSINNILAKMFGSKACAWAVYDDYDTTKSPNGVQEIQSLAQIYISTTSNSTPYGKSKKSITEFRPNLHRADRSHAKMLSSDPEILVQHVTHDKMWLRLFSVRNNTAFVEKSLSLPAFRSFVVKCENRAEVYIDLIRGMNVENSESLLEIINAKAFKSAEKFIGCVNSNSPAEIFQKILDKQYNLYAKACLNIEAIEKFTNLCVRGKYEIIPWEDSTTNPPTMRRHIIGILEHWDNTGSREIPNIVLADEFSDANKRTLESMHEEFTMQRAEHSAPLQKIRETLKDNDCQVCRVELEEIVILKCCNVIVCGICVKGVFNPARGGYQHKDNFVGHCPNCKAKVYSSKDLIYITKGLDVKAMMEQTGVEVRPVEESTENHARDSDFEDDQKMAALHAIINGITPNNMLWCVIDTPNLVQGNQLKPVPANVAHKILIFASFGETLEMIEQYLLKKSVQNVFKLKGTVRQIHTMVQEFKNIKNRSIMLINSNEICAGLNMEFATICITYHRLVNPAITAQINGRFQRVGREFSCDFYHLRYENEIEPMLEIIDAPL